MHKRGTPFGVAAADLVGKEDRFAVRSAPSWLVRELGRSRSPGCTAPRVVLCESAGPALPPAEPALAVPARPAAASRCRGASSTEKTVGRRVQVVVQAFDKWKVARTAGVAPIYWSYEYPFERPVRSCAAAARSSHILGLRPRLGVQCTGKRRDAACTLHRRR